MFPGRGPETPGNKKKVQLIVSENDSETKEKLKEVKS